MRVMLVLLREVFGVFCVCVCMCVFVTCFLLIAHIRWDSLHVVFFIGGVIFIILVVALHYADDDPPLQNGYNGFPPTF